MTSAYGCFSSPGALLPAPGSVTEALIPNENEKIAPKNVIELSIEELAIISFILDEDDIINARRKHKIRRRTWVHPSLLLRKTEGKYYTLYRHLINDEETFLQYCRMDCSTLEMILKKITSKIVKRNTRISEPISPREKFIVRLR
ncbi:hypothetical protein FQA39_LY09160 [Lamprigera yunnana]|nr:hypothetical protein FQA39_LY09160 [Lamprigera yunnana]